MIAQLKTKSQEFLHRIRPIYRFINQRLHGALDVLRIALKGFGAARAPEAAASMAYYIFFSIFPLVLALIAFTSFVLKSQFVQDQILEYIADVFPINPELIANNIQNVLIRRGTVGILAILGLMWSASSMFNTIALNIDRAWPNNVSHNFLERRMIGFAILIGLALGIVLLWLLRAILAVDFVSRLVEFFNVPVLNTTLWGILVFLAPRGFKLLMFWIMFQWLPKASVKPNEALWGAILTLLLSELITTAMNWYLNSSFAQYELVYGSLWRIIVFLLWIYFSSYVILLGAHISSAVAVVTRKNE